MCRAISRRWCKTELTTICNAADWRSRSLSICPHPVCLCRITRLVSSGSSGSKKQRTYNSWRRKTLTIKTTLKTCCKIRALQHWYKNKIRCCADSRSLRRWARLRWTPVSRMLAGWKEQDKYHRRPAIKRRKPCISRLLTHCFDDTWNNDPNFLLRPSWQPRIACG